MLKATDGRIFNWTPIIYDRRQSDKLALIYKNGKIINPENIIDTSVFINSDGIPANLGEIEYLRNHPMILKRIKELSKDKSLKSFIENSSSSEHTGGFNWDTTPEGHVFWAEILAGSYNAEHFYTIYPRELPEQQENLGDIEFLRNYPEILDRIKELSKHNDLYALTVNRYEGYEGGGFQWENSPEGHEFWNDIIGNENISLFYEKYPKQTGWKTYSDDVIQEERLSLDKPATLSIDSEVHKDIDVYKDIPSPKKIEKKKIPQVEMIEVKQRRII